MKRVKRNLRSDPKSAYTQVKRGSAPPTEEPTDGEAQEKDAEEKEEGHQEARQEDRGLSRLAGALARTRRAASLAGGSVLVGLSGGKDSLVTLDIIMRSGAFQRVEAFAMYLVPGMKCFEEPVRRAARRYGIPVHFVLHHNVPGLLKNPEFSPHYRGHDDLKEIKLKDVELALTKKTGIGFFAYGERAADSPMRRFLSGKYDGKDGIRNGRVQVIWDWKKAEVLSYLRARKIPIPPRFGGGNMSGVELLPSSLSYMKKNHPEDYAKILRVFPYVEVQVFRHDRGDFKNLVGPTGRKFKSDRW